MNRDLVLLGSGAGVGAALMCVFDPERGSRRRALVRDKVAHLAHKAPDAFDATARDLRNRARGLIAEARSKFQHDDVDDEVLNARVRSALGRVSARPHAIKVTVNDGRVTLGGPILEGEVDDVIAAVKSVRGVQEVANSLEVHSHATGVPSLQGGRRRTGDRFELLQENWSPAARFLVGAAGGALAAFALRQKFPVSCVLGTIATGMIGRGATNIELTKLLGIDALRNAVKSRTAKGVSDTEQASTGEKKIATEIGGDATKSNIAAMNLSRARTA